MRLCNELSHAARRVDVLRRSDSSPEDEQCLGRLRAAHNGLLAFHASPTDFLSASAEAQDRCSYLLVAVKPERLIKEDVETSRRVRAHQTPKSTPSQPRRRGNRPNAGWTCRLASNATTSKLYGHP